MPTVIGLHNGGSAQYGNPGGLNRVAGLRKIIHTIRPRPEIRFHQFLLVLEAAIDHVVR